MSKPIYHETKADKLASLTEIFGEPISVYTDDQAVDDGTLVAINRKDRVTRPVFEYLAQATPEGAQPPSCWPVEMMGWFRAKTKDDKAIALAVGLIGGHGQIARRIYEHNTGGGIWTAWAVAKDGVLVQLSEIEPKLTGYEIRKLWLLPNGEGGMTLMFPEDY